MGKGWSVFFGVVLFATFIIWPAAVMFGWWLPENVASYGEGVDMLFYLILGFTTFFFVLTEMVLVYAMWQYAERPGEKAVYTHGNHRLEVVWTAIPAAILIFIAVAQIRVWERIKYQKAMPSPDITLSVQARQWEWRMRYPVKPERFGFDEKQTKERGKSYLNSRAWAENPEFDDLHLTNEIHCFMKVPETKDKPGEGANVKMYVRTQDVLHSFTLPNLRLKQDTVPGKTIAMWFRPTKHNCYFDPNGATGPRLVESPNKLDHWEIACQELCGGRHYAMRGRLYVHRDKKSYEAWLEHTRKMQETRGGAPAKLAKAE